MKSKLYRKFRASKYIHKTHSVAGTGNTKGKLVVGTESARHEIERNLGRPLVVHHVEKNRGQWIFCELKANNA